MPRKNAPDKMHVMSAIEHLCHRAGVNHSELAAMCDVSKQAMNRCFSWRQNCSVGIAAQMAEALGYELALVPKGADYPQGSIRVAPILSDKHELGGRR